MKWLNRKECLWLKIWSNDLLKLFSLFLFFSLLLFLMLVNKKSVLRRWCDTKMSCRSSQIIIYLNLIVILESYFSHHKFFFLLSLSLWTFLLSTYLVLIIVMSIRLVGVVWIICHESIIFVSNVSFQLIVKGEEKGKKIYCRFQWFCNVLIELDWNVLRNTFLNRV